MDKPHISFKPQEIFHLFGFAVTNSLLTSFIVVICFLIIALIYNHDQNKPGGKRSAVYFIVNFIVKALHGFFTSVLGEKTDVYFTLLGSFFLFVIFQNWFGLIPGVGSVLLKFKTEHEIEFAPILRGGTADLNTTISLALVSVIVTNYFSIKALGIKKFAARFYRLKDPMSYFIGSLEIISEISKVISFSFRLFGNIFAGEVLLAVIAFLVPVLAAFPFLVLEIFVGFIQAVVFSTLTAVFINVAVQEHH